MKAVLRLDGSQTSIIQHNERLADPLNEYARALAEVSKKRTKTDADHLEMGKREFLGGLYTNENGPCIPAWNILRCLEDGAKRHKQGKNVMRGVRPLSETVDLLYEGPRDPEELWRHRETFSLRKGVGVAGRKVMRTRPIFTGWAAELHVEVDPTIFDLDVLSMIFADAGKYAGLGDMRPIYGCFEGTVFTEDEWLRQTDGAISVLRASVDAAIERIRGEDRSREVSHV